MKTYDIQDKEKRVFAFEVDNGRLGLFQRDAIVKIAQNIAGAKILKVPKSFSWLREEVFCEFEMAGHIFHILEPFGDNSRYWIGPKDGAWYPEIDIIKNIFSSQ